MPARGQHNWTRRPTTGSWRVGEHNEQTRGVAELTKDARSNFEKNISKNPTRPGGVAMRGL